MTLADADQPPTSTVTILHRCEARVASPAEITSPPNEWRQCGKPARRRWRGGSGTDYWVCDEHDPASTPT